MKLRFVQLLFLLISLTDLVPAQESIAYMLRADGHAVEAQAITTGLVTLEMSPAWRKTFQGVKNTRERKAMADLIGAFLDTRLTAGGSRIRSLPTGLMVGALQENKSRNTLRVILGFVPDSASRKGTILGMEQLAEALNRTPSGKEKLAFSFEPEAEGLMQSALRAHGSEVFVTLPVTRPWNRESVEIWLH